ncbi:MAG: hypothetical protein JNJ54_07820 [Myxococcaceae bacterium]|nr:hypothetical protein [Myxococcaceae bacterium]
MRALPLALSFALIATPAIAQKYRVVVLEIDGDQNNKLRNQIESTLVKADVVDVVSLDEFRAEAARKKLNGAAAMTVIGIKRVGKQLKLDAAVTGEIGDKFKVLIYDRAGAELWTKELAIKKGLLSEDFAQKLARAIAAAAEQGNSKNPNDPAPDTAAGSGTGIGGGTGDGPEIDLTGGGDTGSGSGSGGTKTGGGRTVVTPGSGDTGSGTGSSGSGDEGQRDTDLDLESFRKKKRVAPRTITVSIAGATTWRSQCLRPGSLQLASCADFDRLPEAQQPVGTTVTFTPQVPYLGFMANAELFPLASFDSRIVNGFGLLGSFIFGSSVTTIAEQNAQGMSEEKQVTSVDLGWSVQAAWRFHFAMGAGEPQGIGYAGLRGGLQSRNFTIDPTAGVPLPSSQRVAPTGAGFGVIGADLAFPIIRFFRLELGGSIFFNPRPADEQVIGFGNLMDDTGGAVSTGWGLDVGGSGDIIPLGPTMLGWTLKLRYQSFFDRYYGQGQKWTVCNEQQCGGLGEESYLTVTWGVSIAY